MSLCPHVRPSLRLLHYAKGELTHADLSLLVQLAAQCSIHFFKQLFRIKTIVQLLNERQSYRYNIRNQKQLSEVQVH